MNRLSGRNWFISTLLCVTVLPLLSAASEPDPRRGYRLLLEKPFVPAYFDQEVIDNVWKTWPQGLRELARNASDPERRSQIYARYGLTERPSGPWSTPDDAGKPLQFVVDESGAWTPNCFGCHGGSLLGSPSPGLPNNRYALQTLIQETRLTKMRMRKPLMPIDFGALIVPLGTTVGTTNAVIFGVALADDRDKDLNLTPTKASELVHHDMEAPPWWHFRRKERIYLDGFAAKTHRPLMQFALDPSNGPQRFREWEDDFRHIFAFLESVEPPEYPFSIDNELADRGHRLFEQHCAECHGDKDHYPERVVPIDEIGTDRYRFRALTDQHREDYAKNWFSHYGEDPVELSPGGYVAPPLDGIWASAPYLHNGSVPTLWHLLHPDERPDVWRRTTGEYDVQHVGLKIAEYKELPDVRRSADRRHYFDSTQAGKSHRGHRYPDALAEDEKRAVLEYLKTL